MKKLLTIVVALVMVCSAVFVLVACKDNENLEGTAKVVAEASKMTLEELKEASRKEMEASNDTFKVVGLTSVLKKTLEAFQKEYDWVTTENSTSKSDYKDYALLQALETAEKSYFADYALVQDVRSIAAIDGDLLHNYVPSDYKELGLKEADTKPLKGIYFNKLFWTNTNFENVTGLKLYNIWQLAGKSTDKDHISKVSFQTAATEQINMSFLLSCEAAENQARIEKAYKEFYGKDWSSDTYTSAGQQWVTEFIANIGRFHSSDGTAMKETQLKDDWDAGFVYYGAFAKMKDAVGQHYVKDDQNTNPLLKPYVEEYDVKDKDGNKTGQKSNGVNAMYTVKWDWEIEGFNGFMYAMCSQVVNNAKHPYTACLYARYLVTLQAYEGAIYNNSLPAQDGSVGTTKVNQYGYYAPASNSITYAKGDWDRDTHIKNELVENYEYLKTAKITQVNRILGLIAQVKPKY